MSTNWIADLNTNGIAWAGASAGGSRLGLLLRRMHSDLFSCIKSVVRLQVTSRDMRNTAVSAKSCARSLLVETTNRRSCSNVLMRKQAWT